MNEQEEQPELSEDMEMVSPGEMLREARQKLGLSCQQVSDRLNFRVRLVEDIEQDIFDKSLPATFNRGYLRNYAKLVKISADDVVSGFEALNIAELQGAELQSFSKETEKQAANKRLMWISYLILALVIGSTIMWWMQNKHIVNNNEQASKETVKKAIQKAEPQEVIKSVSKIEEPISSTNIRSESSSAEGNTPNSNSSDDILISSTPTTSSTLIGGVIDTVVTNDFNSTEEINESNSAASDSSPQSSTLLDRKLTPSELEDAPAPEYNETENIIQSQVSFTFSGDCWVNIYDNSGERIAWGIKRAGYEMKISGQAPFTVTLGKPELVTIVFEEQNIDMGQFRSGNIAKFTLPITL
jgi:cytoskeleton protein RodZ